jgi:hypothetical protein
VTVNDRSWREHVMSLHALQGTVRPRIICNANFDVLLYDLTSGVQN